MGFFPLDYTAIQIKGEVTLVDNDEKITQLEPRTQRQRSHYGSHSFRIEYYQAKCALLGWMQKTSKSAVK